MQEVFTELRKVPCLNSQYTKKKKKKMVCDTDSLKYSENLNEKFLTIQISKLGSACNMGIWVYVNIFKYLFLLNFIIFQIIL